MLEYHKTTEAEKYTISDWKYEGEYALYNKAPYEEDKRTGRGFANTKSNFFSFVDGEKLVGFTNLVEEGKEVLIRRIAIKATDRECCNRRMIFQSRCSRTSRCIWKCEHGISGLSDAMKKLAFGSTENRSRKQRPLVKAFSIGW